MKKIIAGLLFLCIFFTQGGVQIGAARVAQADTQDTSGDLELVARFDFTNPLSVVASGDLAFVGMQINQSYQVTILDAIDPAHPMEVTAIDLGENDICPLGVIGEMLYISVREEGVRIYDISTPSTLVLVKTFKPLEYLFAWQMVVSGNLAYLADLNGLVILDISDPADPILIGYESNSSSIFSLAIQGNNAYALGGGALRAYDIANPAQPLLLDEYAVDDPTRSNPDTLAINGGFAYLTGRVYFGETLEYYAELIDISDPADLRKLGDLPALAAPTNQLVVAGDLLYAARMDGLAIFDLSNPEDPQPTGTYPGVNGLAVQPQAGRTVYLDQVTGLQLLDTSDPASPTLLGFHNWPQQSNGVEIVGTNLFTVQTYWTNYPIYNASSLLQVTDISDPHSPRVSGQALLDAYGVSEVFADGTTLYLPAVNGLIIVDTAILDDMQAANLSLNGSGSDVEVKQDTAYALSEGWDGTNQLAVLSTIDVANPLAPSVLGQLNVEGYPIDLSVAEQGGLTIAYILTGSGWWAVDVSNPAAPLVVYHDQPAQELQRIATETQGDQTILYLAKAVTYMYNAPDEGLVAIDVSDPTNPLEVGFYQMELSGAMVLMVEDAIVYFADYVYYGGYLQLINFSDPAHPSYVASTGTPVEDASLTQDYIVTTAYSDGIVFFAKHSHLEGQVTDHNFQPFPGVSLALSNGDTTLSDAEGNYTFPDLEFGSYAITPTLAGYAFSPPNRQVSLPQANPFQRFVILPAPVSTDLQPGITTTLTYTDVQALPTSFTFPAGLVEVIVTVTVTPTLADGYFGMRFAGHAFELDIQGIAPDLVYTQPVTATIQYSELDTAVISDTARLALFRWQAGGWVEASANCPSQPTPATQAAGVIQGVLCQDGRYILLGPTYSLAMPVVPDE
jgi:hypothetical protein